MQIRLNLLRRIGSHSLTLIDSISLMQIHLHLLRLIDSSSLMLTG